MELKSYIDHLQLKHPNVFEGDKNPLPRCLASLNRHNSSESINSLNSMFSQKSYQSASLNHTVASDLASVTDSVNNSPFSKSSNKNNKMGWIRSSFSKAFSRKHQAKLHAAKAAAACSETINEHSASVSTSSSDGGGQHQHNRKYVCLSDVDENGYLSHHHNGGSGRSSKNSNEMATGDLECSNRASMNFMRSGLNGDFSLPNSPMHNPMFHNNHLNNYHMSNQ